MGMDYDVRGTAIYYDIEDAWADLSPQERTEFIVEKISEGYAMTGDEYIPPTPLDLEKHLADAEIRLGVIIALREAGYTVEPL